MKLIDEVHKSDISWITDNTQVALCGLIWSQLNNQKKLNTQTRTYIIQTIK